MTDLIMNTGGLSWTDPFLWGHFYYLSYKCELWHAYVKYFNLEKKISCKLSVSHSENANDSFFSVFIVGILNNYYATV